MSQNEGMPVCRWISMFCWSAMFSATAFGCFCSSTPMCSSFSAPSDSSAVFVGRVTEIWPSREALARQERLSLAELKQQTLQRWRGVLSTQEQQEIRGSSQRTDIEFRYAYMQRIRFVVNETLAGPEVHEVFTDVSCCGYRFEVNHVYLVNSTQTRLRYRTEAC